MIYIMNGLEGVNTKIDFLRKRRLLTINQVKILIGVASYLSDIPIWYRV